MKESSINLPIGVFDSGMGGVSVLADLIHQLPGEEYIYFGDSANAPYGIKNKEEVKKLSLNVAESLLKYNIKALVVACNTATSVAVEDLRNKLIIPVIGMEPALKPAIELNKPGKIIVMATPVTLREKKFNSLINKFKNTTNVIKMPCPGLVEIIETDGNNDLQIKDYIKKVFSPYESQKIGTIVLGCTHYVFIKDIISNIINEDISIVDGNLGTAKHVKYLLDVNSNLMPVNTGNFLETKVKIINSSTNPSMVNLSKELLKKRLRNLNWAGKIEYVY